MGAAEDEHLGAGVDLLLEVLVVHLVVAVYYLEGVVDDLAAVV